MKKLILTLIAGLALAASSSAQESGALLDLLVNKKILTPQEAEDVRASLAKENSETSAGKIKLADSLTELKLYGDLRLRYQYDNRDFQVDPSPVVDGPGDRDRSPSGTQNSRWRFRLRLNAEFKLAG